MTPPPGIILATLFLVLLATLYPYPLRSGARWVDIGLQAFIKTASMSAGLAVWVLLRGRIQSVEGVWNVVGSLATVVAATVAMCAAGSLIRRVGVLKRADARVTAAQLKTERRLARGDRPEGSPLMFRE